VRGRRDRERKWERKKKNLVRIEVEKSNHREMEINRKTEEGHTREQDGRRNMKGTSEERRLRQRKTENMRK